jgi:hypothetical protein
MSTGFGRAQAYVEEDSSVEASLVAWQALWQLHRSNANYNPDFGIESAWRMQWQDWGVPLEDDEIVVQIDGGEFRARNFHKIGLVFWDPEAGAKIYGRPS